MPSIATVVSGTVQRDASAEMDVPSNTGPMPAESIVVDGFATSHR